MIWLWFSRAAAVLVFVGGDGGAHGKEEWSRAAAFDGGYTTPLQSPHGTNINLSNVVFNLVHNISMHKRRPKRSRLQLYRLKRRKRREEDMEVRNLKLYMENMSILEENEKLRKKASLLHQENLALLSEFQHRFSCVPLPPLP
nr:protein LITTLE ZIPPER 1-like [Ipomoea batatas]